VAVEAIDVDGAAAHDDLGDIVGEGRAHAGTQIENLASPNAGCSA
jgi:hypothetical protein